jgi:porphobilinogen synthase
MSSALVGRRVLVPSGGALGDRIVESLTAAGADVIAAPVIGIAPPGDPAALAAALDDLRTGAYDWLVLTSATTIDALVGVEVPEGTSVAAIGPRTAEAARAAGIRVDLVPAGDHSATGLLDVWPPTAAGARALLPASALAAPDLGDGLEARGLRVHRVEAYRPTPIAPRQEVVDDAVAGRFDAVVITAGSVARRLVELVGALPTTTAVVAIGPRTRVDASEAGLLVAATAPERSSDGLVAAVVAAVGTAPEPVSTSAPTPAIDWPLPRIRPRRLRATEPWRRLVAETRVHPSQLVLPMFVREGIVAPVPISSMPGVVQHDLDSFRAELSRAAAAGVGGVMLFGVPEHKDARGSGADDPDGILAVATRIAVEEVGDALVVQADLCLDEFTDHGHCGVLDARGRVDNDASLERYRSMASVLADAGAALLGLSGMMDGQTAAVRDALDADGHHDVALLAYAAKYASAAYGPFREAVGSSLQGHRRGYQLDPANGREGRREAALDLAEGADIVMVKPATLYLDVLAAVAATSPVPVWAYHVSGEYAMVEAAAERGWIDRDRMIAETITGIVRAGADAVLTYWALELAERIR